MFKNVRSILTGFTILILLGAAAIPVFAQDGGPESGGAEASSEVFSAPFQGTGELAEGSPLVDAAALNALPMESANPETVIGADGRAKINVTTSYPNRAIASLVMTFPNAAVYICTGWFIGPDDVATAAHCIYSAADGGYATSIIVYPGRNGASAPYGSTTMINRWVAPAWPASATPANDYGLIRTATALGNTVGWFGFAWQASNVFPDVYTLTGYPGDKPSGTMWSMKGRITHVGGSRLWYSIDTAGGQSGSPVFRRINNVCCYGFGIHTYGTSVAPYFGNSATRISKGVFNLLKAWRNTP